MVSDHTHALRRHRARLLLCLLGLLLSCRPALAGCEDLIPPREAGHAAVRPVTGRDLLALRDIGQPDNALFETQSPFGLSPDGKRLAFVIDRGDPEGNIHCRALVAISLAGPPDPQVLDRGGDFPMMKVSQRGGLLRLGIPNTVTPVWSPDGRRVAYLRWDHGTAQVWLARSDGSGARAMTRSPVDVEAVAWSADGKRLVYAARPGLVEAARQIDAESRGGWLYDRRIVPNIAARPVLPTNLAKEILAVDADSGEMREVTAADRARLGDESAPLSSLSVTGRRGWSEHVSPNPASPSRVVADGPRGRPVTCPQQACNGFTVNLWWDVRGQSLIILRREGWNKSEMALLRWRPGERQVRRLLRTGDQLHGCLPAGPELVCTSENAVTPRRVIAIDLRTGARRPVFDANPEFHALGLGTVTRLTWRNAMGLPAWGDLVLPPDYKPGTRLPLIITQYHSDGFLRGATGDEYPIHAFAARGFAVLSLERPPLPGSDRSELKSGDELYAFSVRDWADRKSLFSSIMTGVQEVIDRGIADPARIGISGLSDGATQTRYALVNSNLFAAASISSCCTDTNAMMNSGGIAFAEAMRAVGYPPSIRDDRAYWAPLSMTLAARRMNRPLLMQLADSELNLGLETFTALHEAGQPVEMYVFPDETHIKWQPAHRLAIYERNLDWFSFWLQGRIDPDPAKAAQYARWIAMKQHLAEPVSVLQPPVLQPLAP